MSRDREEVSVHTMNPVHQVGPVIYASLTRDSGSRKGKIGEEAKQFLVSSLWDHLVAMESPLWKHCQTSTEAACPIQVLCGLLGRPYLLVGGNPGPAISFSEGGGKVWAALSGDESDIGIDAAGSDEFQGEYPFQRAFHPEELQHAMSLANGEVAGAAALLWSVKEAVVKALGCAFHLVDPRQISVYPSAEGATGEDGGYTFQVGLAGKARVRFPQSADRSLRVRSIPLDKIWLSIAHVNRAPVAHE